MGQAYRLNTQNSTYPLGMHGPYMQELGGQGAEKEKRISKGVDGKGRPCFGPAVSNHDIFKEYHQQKHAVLSREEA